MALSMSAVSKRFPGTLAVDRVDFEARAGEVHALMGENGAGKSTLMKILAGSFDDYEGCIRIGGQEVALHSPAAARAHGIGMIYQELSLARPISIAENLLVGRLPRRRGVFLDRAALRHQASALLERVGLRLDPSLPVEAIDPHQAQLVEIAKALGSGPGILVMDEPTSALSRAEVQRLFEIIRQLRREGLTIVYISHHLSEVFEVADRVTVLRDGRKIATRELGGLTPAELVHMMVGQTIDEFYGERVASVGAPVLRASGLGRKGFFRGVSFEAREGEVLGIAGLSGAGRTELARSMCGLDPLDEGTVELGGIELPRRSYAEAMKNGLCYLSEDRKTDGLFLRLSVRQNLCSALIRRESRVGLHSGAGEEPITAELMDALEISAASPAEDVGNLSGGNQQKVLLGKWLAAGPQVLVLDEPSRGVDVKAKRKIHEAVISLADRGNTVVLISSDLPELVGLADRVLVMRQGSFLGELKKSQLSEESILLAANGEPVPAAPGGGA